MSADLAALEQVYRSRLGAFERVAAAITGDRELGRDAVHDGFVRAVRQLRGFRGEAPLEAWVWRIVVNEARRRGAAGALVPATHPLDPRLDRAAPNGSEPDDRARAIVAALPERQRLTLFLRYYADLDYHAIAEALHVKPGTVAATLNAAHAAVRRQLEQEVSR